jgi:hypothetical protein
MTQQITGASFGEWTPEVCWHKPFGNLLLPRGVVANTWGGTEEPTIVGAARRHTGSTHANWVLPALWPSQVPLVIGGLFVVNNTATADQTAVGLGDDVVSGGLYAGIGQRTATLIQSWGRLSDSGGDATLAGPAAVIGRAYAVIRIDTAINNHVMFVNGVRYSNTTSVSAIGNNWENFSIGASVRHTTAVFPGLQSVLLGFAARTNPGESWAQRFTEDPFGTLFVKRKRSYFIPETVGGFNPAWARHRSQVIGAGMR